MAVEHTANWRQQSLTLTRLAATNPFSDQWTALVAAALGTSARKRDGSWSIGADAHARGDTVSAVEALTSECVARMLETIVRGASDADCALFRELVLFHLYNQAIPLLDGLVQGDSATTRKLTGFRELSATFERLFSHDARTRPSFGAAHAFAGFFQLRRAFFHIFRFIVGTSRPTAQLRAAVWQAIFTADAARYRRALFDRMRDVPTLVLGETGTGKELVARAIGLSGFVPFDAERLVFAGDAHAGFFPIHLQALSPTLIESALFGHKKGAFTGALADRSGVFAACPPWGAVFLDEIGELEPALQTKLLRVLETRDFAPLGSDAPQRFTGRVVAATNRDLSLEMTRGGFRRDVYFRLAGVTVRTPPLRERVRDDADELPRLVQFLAQHIAGSDEGLLLSQDVLRALSALGPNHPWPGNVRELAQHVRAVLVNGTIDVEHSDSHDADWLAQARAGQLSADALLTAYVRHVFALEGSYQATAERIALDRRTVKARVSS